MAMPRLDGSTSFISTSPISSLPELMSSSPAIIRSRVDLPQPDGPTKTTNSPERMSRSTPLITSSAPKLLRICVSVTSAMAASSFHGEGDCLRLEEPAFRLEGHGSGALAGLDPEAGGAALEAQEGGTDNPAVALQRQAQRL